MSLKKYFSFRSLFFTITILGIILLLFWAHNRYAIHKIAVIYTAMGTDIHLWEDFYKQSEKNFLPRHPKHYFVFTDDTQTNFPKNVTRIEHKQMSWPENTLTRWKMLLSLEKELEQYDYIYTLNPDMEVISPVEEEIFPTKKQGLVVVWHPAYYYNQDPYEYAYDRNPHSTAYIPMGTGIIYAQKTFIGGCREDYIKMIKTLSKHLSIDQRSNQTAIWREESHLNRYIYDKNPLILPPNYNWAMFDPRLKDQFKDNIKIQIRSKKNSLALGDNFSKEKNNSYNDSSTQKPNSEEIKNALLLSHENWTDYLILKEKGLYCRFLIPTECAIIKQKKAGKKIDLFVNWQNWGTEVFEYDFVQKIYKHTPHRDIK